MKGRKLKRLGGLWIFVKALIGTAAGVVAWLVATWLVFLPMGPQIGGFLINLGFWVMPAFGLYQGIRWGRLTEYEPPAAVPSVGQSEVPDAPSPGQSAG